MCFMYKIELILQKLNSLASTTTSDESNLEFTHSFLHRKKVCWTTFLFYCNIFVFVVFLLNDVFFYFLIPASVGRCERFRFNDSSLKGTEKLKRLPRGVCDLTLFSCFV